MVFWYFIEFQFIGEVNILSGKHFQLFLKHVVKIYFYYLCLYIHVYFCVSECHMYALAYRSQRGVSDTLSLYLLVNFQVCIQGTELGSSGKAAGIHKC